LLSVQQPRPNDRSFVKCNYLPKKEKPMQLNAPSSSGALATYLSELRQYPLLKAEEERELAQRFRSQQDAVAAHRLITSNLRFVVKVAYEYRSYGLRMADLI